MHSLAETPQLSPLLAFGLIYECAIGHPRYAAVDGISVWPPVSTKVWFILLYLSVHLSVIVHRLSRSVWISWSNWVSLTFNTIDFKTCFSPVRPFKCKQRRNSRRKATWVSVNDGCTYAFPYKRTQITLKFHNKWGKQEPKTTANLFSLSV